MQASINPSNSIVWDAFVMRFVILWQSNLAICCSDPNIISGWSINIFLQFQHRVWVRVGGYYSGGSSASCLSPHCSLCPLQIQKISRTSGISRCDNISKFCSASIYCTVLWNPPIQEAGLCSPPLLKKSFKQEINRIKVGWINIFSNNGTVA